MRDSRDLTIKLDPLSEMMLRRMVDHHQGKPVEPDAEIHTGHDYETKARRYDEWDRLDSAMRLLLAPRLIEAVGLSLAAENVKSEFGID